MTFLIRYWPHALIVAVTATIVAFSAYSIGAASGDLRAAKAELALSHLERDTAYRLSEAEARAREIERKRVEDLAALADRHEQELQDAQARSDRVVAGLRAGTVQLRREIAAYATERLSRDSTAPAELGEAAERGAELVGAAVGVGAQCDATQAALIEAYEALRRPAP